MNPWRQLPPLSALRAFEAAARHENYSRAAEELHVTHGAISHQIHTLQNTLSVKLFERHGKQMRLTESGQRLAQDVRVALEMLTTTTSKLNDRYDARALTVSVLPSFAAAWLVERLGAFMQQYPEIDLNLESTTTLANFHHDGVDVAIRYGNGNWPGLEVEKLLDDVLFPVRSPALYCQHRLRNPGHLLKLPLIRQRQEPWAPWFAAAGTPASEPRRGPVFNNAELALQAAMRGQGLVLARQSLIGSKLRDKALIAPFRLRIAASSAYYLVYPSISLQKTIFHTFREWLMQEIIASKIPLKKTRRF